MKTLLTILPIFIFVVSCGQSQNQRNNEINNHQVKTYTYTPSSIPAFLKLLVKNHKHDYLVLDSIYYNDFFRKNELNAIDSTNIEKYYTLKILHDLFTSETASNCSKGEVLNIPYQWHWVSPNPRHTIRYVESGKLLSVTKPPVEFGKYNSCADIDRTPYLFLSDLFATKSKYYSESCDTFPSFGWCSEREMAFVCLLDILGYSGKVMVNGGHSWSEFVVPMKTKDGNSKKFCVSVDNTFNKLNWVEIKDKDVEAWKKYFGDSPQANWYNQKAHAVNDKNKINAFIVSKAIEEKTEISLVEYLKKKAVE
jgi:hypothetical protein